MYIYRWPTNYLYIYIFVYIYIYSLAFVQLGEHDSWIWRQKGGKLAYKQKFAEPRHIFGWIGSVFLRWSKGLEKYFCCFTVRVLWTCFGTKDGAELHAAKWAMKMKVVFILLRIMKSQMVEIPIKQTVSWNLIRKLFFAIYFRSSFDIWGGLVNVCQTFEVAFLVEFFENLRPLDQWTPDVFFFDFLWFPCPEFIWAMKKALVV